MYNVIFIYVNYGARVIWNYDGLRSSLHTSWLIAQSKLFFFYLYSKLVWSRKIIILSVKNTLKVHLLYWIKTLVWILGTIKETLRVQKSATLCLLLMKLRPLNTFRILGWGAAPFPPPPPSIFKTSLSKLRVISKTQTLIWPFYYRWRKK